MMANAAKDQNILMGGSLQEDVLAIYQRIYEERSQLAKKRRKQALVEGAIGISAFLCSWFVISHSIVPKLPDPWITLTTDIPRIVDPWFYKSCLFSLYRVVVAFIVASITAIPLGLIMGWNRIARDLFTPTFELLRPVPPIAWVPLSVIILANLEYSVLFITFTGAFFVIALNARLGAESIDPNLLRAALCLGASPWYIFRHVVLPGALPFIFSGLALGMGISWGVLVAGEMIAGQYGLGYLTWESYNLIRYPEVILSMASLGIFGYIFSSIIRALGNKVLAWRKVYTNK